MATATLTRQQITLNQVTSLLIQFMQHALALLFHPIVFAIFKNACWPT